MEGHKLGQIVNNPDAVGSRKETNAKNNDNKKLLYQDGQDARKARKRKRGTGAEVEASEEEESQPEEETANPSKKRKIRAPRKTQPARKVANAAQEGALQQHVDAPARHDSVGTGMPTVQATNARESGTGIADAHLPAALAEALRNRTASTPHRPDPSSFDGIQAQQPSQPASSPAASLAPPQVSAAQEGESRTSVAPGLTPVADPALNAPANMPYFQYQGSPQYSQRTQHSQLFSSQATSMPRLQATGAASSIPGTGEAEIATMPVDVSTYMPADMGRMAQIQAGSSQCELRSQQLRAQANLAPPLQAGGSRQSILGSGDDDAAITLPSTHTDTLPDTSAVRRSSRYQGRSTSPPRPEQL